MVAIIKGPAGSGKTTQALNYFKDFPKVWVWNFYLDRNYDDRNKFNVYSGDDILFFYNIINNSSKKTPIIIDTLNIALTECLGKSTYFEEGEEDSILLQDFSNFIKFCYLQQVDLVLIVDTPNLDTKGSHHSRKYMSDLHVSKLLKELEEQIPCLVTRPEWKI